MPRRVALALGLMLLVSFTNGLGLVILLPLLQAVGLAVDHGAMGWLTDGVTAALQALHIAPDLKALLAVYVVVVSAAALLGRWSTLVSASVAQAFPARLRAGLYESIARAEWLFIVRLRSSDLTQVLTMEAVRVAMATGALLSLLVSVAAAAIYAGFALLLSPLFTLLVLLVGLTFFVLFQRRARLAHTIGSKIVQANETMHAAVSENLAGLKLTKSHGLEAAHVDAFARLVDRVAGLCVASARNTADVAFWHKTGSTLALAVLVYLGLAIFELSVAALLLLLFLFSRIVPRFADVQRQYQAFLSALPGFTAMMDLQARCDGAGEALGVESEPLQLAQAVRMEAVWFGYDRDGAAARAVLRGLDLTVCAGHTTAVVGPSGSGKSTVADLLIGLITPERGRVLFDSRPLSASQLRSWREQLAYVPQDAFLFHDTVRANLRVMRPDASEEEMWDVLRLAAADGFVAQLPGGLDTVLGDRGVRVSGGERQRLALARALLRRPRFLVLDEATSALDAESERRIQRAIDGLHGRMTILIIAHRLSTIRHADRIYVLERGRVVELGDWDTLLRRPQGRFRSLCLEQGLIVQPQADAPDLTTSSGEARSPR